MIRHETRALTLAREIVRLLDLWNATDGAQGCEDVRNAMLSISLDGSEIADLAEALVALDTACDDDVTESLGGEWLDACHDYGLIDTSPDDVVDEDGMTGCVYWSGFGSEQAIRKAVAS